MKLSQIVDYCTHEGNGRRRVSISTQQLYEVVASRLIEYFETDRIEVENITADDLLEWEEWLDARATAGTVTTNTYKRVCRAMWNHMRQPRTKNKRPDKLRHPLNVINPSHLFTFAHETKGVKSISKKNAVRMLAFSGIRETALLLLAEDSARRRGGLARLHVDNMRIFEDEDGELCLVGTTTEKGEKPQIVLGGEEVAMAMQVWLYIREMHLQWLKVKDHGYVFINLQDGSPMSPDLMGQQVRRLRQSAGIPKDEPANLHSFRHKRAKELLKLLSLPEVRDILGHAEASTTADIYAVNGEEELISAFFSVKKKERPGNTAPA